MKKILLSKNNEAIVDNEDYEGLMSYKWCSVNGYAVRGKKIGGKVKLYFMHREILKPRDNEVVDHINGNKSDNRKANLRRYVSYVIASKIFYSTDQPLPWRFLDMFLIVFLNDLLMVLIYFDRF